MSNNVTQSSIENYFRIVSQAKTSLGKDPMAERKKFSLSLRKGLSESPPGENKKRKIQDQTQACGSSKKINIANQENFEENKLVEICDYVSAYVDKDATFDCTENQNLALEISDSIAENVTVSDLHVSNMKEVIIETLNHPENTLLLTEQQKAYLIQLLSLPFFESKLCIRLFYRLNSWHIYSKFIGDSRLQLDLSSSEIGKCFDHLQAKNIILTDYSQEKIEVLLNLLNADSVKKIGNKFNLKNTSKSSLVEQLIKKTKNKSTLLFGQSSNVTKNLLKEIKLHLGKCIKLNPEFRAALIRTQLLFSISQRFSLPHDLHNVLSNLKYNCNLYPKYKIDQPKIFQSIEQYNAYEHFYLLRDKISINTSRRSKPSSEDYIVVGLEAFNKLKEILSKEEYLSWHEHALQLPSFLKRFSLGEILISIVWSCFDEFKKVVHNKCRFSMDAQDSINDAVKNVFNCEKMTSEHLFEILNTLLNQSYYKQSRKTEWTEEMVTLLVQMNRYDEALQSLISVLKCEKNEIAMFNISERAERVIHSKKEFNPELIETIGKLINPLKIDIPCITIDAVEAFQNTIGNKKVYKCVTEDTTKFFTVEQVALEYYKEEGFENGTHSEQAQIVTIFGLLFWDIIYSYYVPNTFITKLQTQPLDMGSSVFFKNRQPAIEERLKNIESWTEEELFAKINFAKQVENTCSVLTPLYCENPDILKDFIKCIERPVLAKIMERLARNFGMTRSGFPDLIVWSPTTKKCKFVEVKSLNDKLSNKQKLWLQYLNNVGADAEVCSVHSVGAKRKKVHTAFNIT